MSTHIAHDVISATGLHDYCPRCEEHADDPFSSLDDSVIASLVRRVLNGGPARSENEATAMGHVRAALSHEETLRRLRRKGMIL